MVSDTNQRNLKHVNADSDIRKLKIKLIPSAMIGTGILGYANSVQSDCELDCEIQIPNDFEINIFYAYRFLFEFLSLLCYPFV